MSKRVVKSIRIILLDSNESLCNSWTREWSQLESIILHKNNLRLCQLPLEVIVHNEGLDKNISKFKPLDHSRTAIVSPGNSGGFLGGGFDLVMAKFFQPSNWKDFESVFQQKLFKLTNGYSNRAHLIDLDIREGPAWDTLRCDAILHLPTMKIPKKLTHSVPELNQIVFDFTWDILSTLTRYNRVNDSNDNFISTMMIPGLATGYGGVPIDTCARAMCYAIAIFSMELANDKERLKLCLRYLGEDQTKLFPGDTGKRFDFSSDGPEVLFGTLLNRLESDKYVVLDA